MLGAHNLNLSRNCFRTVIERARSRRTRAHRRRPPRTMAEFISGSVWRAKSPNAQADEAAGPSHPPPRYAAKYRLSTLHQAREGDTRAVLCVAAAATSSPWSAPPPGWPFAGYPPGRPGGAQNVRAIASVRTTAEELCLAGSVFRSDYLFLPIAAAFSLPSSGQLPLYDGDLAVVFQDCRPDLRYIRAALMAQRFGKLCQRNVCRSISSARWLPCLTRILGVPSRSRPARLL
jgi:hypothetical protein